jgi:glycosyltransferase involved in cell wall biosynthesis
MERLMKRRAREARPLVILQQACVPHYRQRLFERLGADPRFRFQVLADPTADVPFLALSTTLNQCEVEPAKQYLIRLSAQRPISWQPKAVWRMLRDRPDVMIAQGSVYDLTAWALTVVGRMIGIPVLLWTHGLRGEESGMKWVIRACLYRLSRGLMLYGDYAKQLLISKGIPADRLHAIYNSLDDSTQTAVSERITSEECEVFRHSLGIEGHERLICFTGRLQPVKGLPWLLRALNIVVQQGRSVHLVLVGDGSDRPILESLAEELGLTRLVHFLGAVYDESRLGLVLMASDLAVVPSGAGLSVMHALAYGTPVLLHDDIQDHFPEWEAVKEGETGWFYEKGDLSDCAQKIIDALFPSPRKPAMAAACRAMIGHRYNTATHAELFVEAITKYCPFTSPGGTERPLPDAVRRSGPIEHSTR